MFFKGFSLPQCFLRGFLTPTTILEGSYAPVMNSEGRFYRDNVWVFSLATMVELPASLLLVSAHHQLVQVQLWRQLVQVHLLLYQRQITHVLHVPRAVRVTAQTDTTWLAKCYWHLLCLSCAVRTREGRHRTTLASARCANNRGDTDKKKLCK